MAALDAMRPGSSRTAIRVMAENARSVSISTPIEIAGAAQ
jgi:hypothetical protein